MTNTRGNGRRDQFIHAAVAASVVTTVAETAALIGCYCATCCNHIKPHEHLPPANADDNALVRVCPVRALTFESLDLETSFVVRTVPFKIFRSRSYIKVIV